MAYQKTDPAIDEEVFYVFYNKNIRR